MNPLSTYTTLYRFSSSDREAALRHTAAQVEARLDGPHRAALLGRIAEALAHEEALRALELRWRQQRSAPPVEGDRRQAALVVQRRLAALDVHLENLARMTAFADDDPRGDQAAALRRTLFPDGRGAVTLQKHDALWEQADALCDLLDHGRWAPLHGPLGLGLFLDGLRDDVDRLGALRNVIADGPTLTWDEVRAARQRGQDHLVGVFFYILGVWSGQDAEASATRTALSGGILRRNAQAGRRAQQRRQRSAAPRVEETDVASGPVAPEAPASADADAPSLTAPTALSVLPDPVEPCEDEAEAAR